MILNLADNHNIGFPFLNNTFPHCLEIQMVVILHYII